MNISMKRLEITTRIGCKIACRSCPQAALQKAYGRTRSVTLTTSGFCQLLSNVNNDVMICFAGMSEPWGNPACTEMVKYAVKKGHPVSAYTTLTGWTSEVFECLKGIRFDEFVVHLPDRNANAKIPITEEYLELLQRVIAEGPFKNLQVTGFSCHGELDPRIISYIPENIFVSRELNDRAGNVRNLDGVKSNVCRGQMLCLRCADRLDQNVLLPDGTILLCCMDYGMQHVLGNLYKATYQEILQKEEAQRIRNAMRADGDSILCRKCINAKNIYQLYEAYQEYYNWANVLYAEQTGRSIHRSTNEE